MLLLFVILLIILKGISVLLTKFISNLAKQPEKTAKLVTVHKTVPLYIDQQVA